MGEQRFEIEIKGEWFPQESPGWVDELVTALNAGQYQGWRRGVLMPAVEIEHLAKVYLYWVNKPASYPDFTDYVAFLERRLAEDAKL